MSHETPVRIVSVHHSAVAPREFGLVGPHDLFVRAITAISDTHVVRSLEAA